MSVTASMTSELVARPRLVRHVLGTPDVRLVLLVAPAGYGKTTLVAQWDEQDERPFARLTLTEAHNEPGALLCSIGRALDAIDPIDQELLAALQRPRRKNSTVMLRRLLQCMEGWQEPFVLALDDVHVLRGGGSLEALAAIVEHLPSGSQLAVVSRTEPAMRISRLRAGRKLVELRVRDLEMTPSEAAALLEAAGLDIDEAKLETLVRRSEGWAAGLYLGALSLARTGDSLVADYLREEVLSALPADRIAMLRHASVLDRLDGPVCDAVLGRSDSARLLPSLARANVMVFPVDRDGSYRCHPQLKEMLLGELRIEPELEPVLHRRAAAWYAEHDDAEGAIRHATAARDAGLAGRLLWENLLTFVPNGRNDTVKGWLDHFSDEEVAGQPALALVAANSHLTRGDRNLAEHWMSAAGRRLVDAPSSELTTELEAGLAILRAGVAVGGIDRMRQDALHASELLPEDSPWRAMCCLLSGTALYLSGERSLSRTELNEGARRGAVSAPHVQALCLAQLALLAIEEDDWASAEVLATRARAQTERFRLSDYPSSALVFAVSARVRAHRGYVDTAGVDLRLSWRLMSVVTDYVPWYEAETRLVLARAALRLGDVPRSRELLEETSRLLRGEPDSVVLREWLDDAWARLDQNPGPSLGARWSLTASELRVLQLLPTHLSFPEMAGLLNVSANTVKTHARAVYRKLDASSRGEAVARARASGLVDASPFALAEAA